MCSGRWSSRAGCCWAADAALCCVRPAAGQPRGRPRRGQGDEHWALLSEEGLSVCAASPRFSVRFSVRAALCAAAQCLCAADACLLCAHCTHSLRAPNARAQCSQRAHSLREEIAETGRLIGHVDEATRRRLPIRRRQPPLIDSPPPPPLPSGCPRGPPRGPVAGPR